MDNSFRSRSARTLQSRRIDQHNAPQLESLEQRALMTAAVALLSDNVLLKFDTDAPAALQRGIVVSGLRAGEELASIDFNPFDGMLYGLATGGTTDSLYRINLTSGAATPIANVSGLVDDDATIRGMDFDPTRGLLSLTTDIGGNRLLNIYSGASSDLPLTLGEDDAIADIAFSNNTARSDSTTLYGINFSLDSLVRIDPDDGSLTTIGDLGLSSSRFAGFDIAADGTAFAALNRAEPGGDTTSVFGTIDLATGLFTQTGTIGGQSATTIRGLTIQPPRHAPVFNTTQNYTFAPVNEDALAGRTMLIRDLLSSAGVELISDADYGALKGIALTSADFNAGRWSYTLDGTHFSPVPSVDAANALLLPADSTAALRFIPAANRNGDADALEFRAWDQTSGVAGAIGRIDDSELISSLSADTNSADVTINATYDAPSLVFGATRLTVHPDSFARPFQSISLFSIDGDDVTVRVRLNLAGRGALTDESLDIAGFIPTATPGEFVLRGQASQVQAMVRILRFKPVFGAGDVNAILVLGDDVTPNAQTYTMTISTQAVNRAPTITGTVATMRTPAATPTAVLGAAAIADADPGQALTVTVKLGNQVKGAFTAASLRRAGLTNIGGGQFRFTGSAADATAAVRKLRYQFKANLPHGPVHRCAITLSVTDGLSTIVQKTVTLTLSS